MKTQRTDTGRRRVAATWHDYEYAKQEWAHRNPRATPDEYQAAMARIARRIGV